MLLFISFEFTCRHFLADACFKAALSLVPEMPKTIDIDGRQKSSQPYLLSYLSNFLSTLLVVPVSILICITFSFMILR